MDSNSNPHNIVCFGEILWDLLPTGAQPGGAPMNVAYHLQKLGNSPALITKIGLDEKGKKLLNMLADAGLNTEYFQVDYDHPTGIVNASPNGNNEVVYDIVYPVAWDFISWEDSFESLVTQSEMFVFGSLINRNFASRKTLWQLLEMAKLKVLDINLRPPYFDRKLVEELLTKADILKLNLAELELITGWFVHYNSVDSRLKLLQDKFMLDTIIVTMGSEGAVLKMNGDTFRHNGYKVVVEDTVGSGDSFLAAFLSGYLKKRRPEEMLDYASAMGAYIVTRKGACPNYELNELENFILEKQKHQLVNEKNPSTQN